MNDQGIKHFFEKVETDTELAAKVKVASSLKDVVELAKSEGFAIEADDLVKIASAVELSEDELNHITGAGPLNDERTRLKNEIADIDSERTAMQTKLNNLMQQYNHHAEMLVAKNKADVDNWSKIIQTLH